jgi:phage-related holin
VTRDANVLRLWLLVVVVISAIMATTVPVLYSRYRWRKYMIGRVFMYIAVSLAAALDMTVLFQFWTPDILVIFWIETAIFTALAVSTSMAVIVLWKKVPPWKGKRKK